jgi:hypothetical protein
MSPQWTMPRCPEPRTRLLAALARPRILAPRNPARRFPAPRGAAHQRNPGTPAEPGGPAVPAGSAVPGQQWADGPRYPYASGAGWSAAPGRRPPRSPCPQYPPCRADSFPAPTPAPCAHSRLAPPRPRAVYARPSYSASYISSAPEGSAPEGSWAAPGRAGSAPPRDTRLPGAGDKTGTAGCGSGRESGEALGYHRWAAFPPKCIEKAPWPRPDPGRREGPPGPAGRRMGKVLAEDVRT